MSRNHELKTTRNDKIKSDYSKLENEKIHGVQKYRHEAILHILSKRYYLTPGTIQNILITTDQPDNQTKLFEQ